MNVSSLSQNPASMSDSAELVDIAGRAIPFRKVDFSGICEIVRDAIGKDLCECGMSRAEIALRLSDMVGKSISKDTIDAWTASTKPHRFPAEWLPAWVYITKSLRLLEVLTGPVGLSLATQEDRDFAELGRIKLNEQKLTKKLWEKI